MVISIALGVVVGIIMGLTGAGGGVLAVPLLVFGLHLTVAEAGPIGLLGVAMAAAIGALIGLKAHTVRYRAALFIAGTGIVMAPFGVWLAQRLDASLLSLVFAAVLVSVAYKTVMEVRVQHEMTGPTEAPPLCKRDAQRGRFVWTRHCAGVLAAFGGLAGILSGLLGVGGGFVLVPALQRYTDMAARSVIATSLAVIALVSFAGVVGSIAMRQLDIGVGLPFAAGGAIGMGVGSLLSSHFSQKALKLAFAVICAAVSVAMVFKSM